MKKQTVILFLLAAITLTTTAQNIDINILKQVNRNETVFKNNYFNTTADLVTPLSFAVPAAIAATGFITKNNQLKKDAVFIAGSYIGSAAITYSIKHIVKRQRPYQKYSFIAQRVIADNDLSFPSGHTSAAFATATSVALRYKKWYFVTPAYIFAGSVAWARMYQGVHYPTDVLAGAVIGAGSAWLGYTVQKKWFTKRKSNPAVVSSF